MADELIGFLFWAPLCLFILMLLTETRDALVARWRKFRRTRRASRHGTPSPEPERYLGPWGFRPARSDSRLRQRHWRQVELEPRGSLGFKARWTRGG